MPYAHIDKTPESVYLKIIDLDRPGERLTSVIEIDSDAGWLRRYALDDAGHVVTNPDNRDELMIERVEGRFRIDIKLPGDSEYREWKPAAAPAQ
jgi:hypothetical protein